MKAVILAGGKGTRLRTQDVPKPMIKIGDKPILEHQILLLKKHGIVDIIIITQHLHNVIEEHFGTGKKIGVNIIYFQEKTPLGTTGGIKEIEDLLTSDFIVLYGDIMLDIDFKRFIEFHKNKKSEATLLLHPNDHPFDSDLVEIDNNCRITCFYPKPHKEGVYYRNLVNAGAYIFSPKIIKHIKKGIKEDFGRDLFPRIVDKIKMHGLNSAEYAKDVGTPERLEEVRKDFSSGKINKLNFQNKRKAIFLDRDGTINDTKNFIYKEKDMKLYSFSSQAIKMINNSDFLAIVITNQPVIARNLCTINDVNKIHNKMETLLGKEGAKLDAIYFCPHHPDKGFPDENKDYKMKCNCRKPDIGMVLLAQKEFNIDLKNSYFVGDSFRDIECGKNAGLKTIGVKTGDGLVENSPKPDIVCENLLEAVELILK